VGGEETWLHTRFWASMLATEAIYLLSRIAPPVTVPTLARYRLDSWKMQRLHIPKSHDCVNCYLPRGLAPGSMEDLEPAKGVPPNLTAVFYEDAVSLPSRHLINPKGHQAHYRTVNVEKTYEGKRYLDAEQVALPSYEQLPQLEGSTLEHLRAMDSERLSHETLNLINLTALLLFSAGVRPIDGSMPGKLRRWSPTGGNLGSVELYVAASQVEGLDPGIYFYQPREHTLARLSQSKRQADVIDFIEQVAPDEHRDGDGALIIMVAAHHRVLSKYGAFAYRIINLDAGVALGQLHMVGSSLGLKTHTVRRWADDIIADRLNLEAINEGVTGALLVREAGK
jgi:SagB-type dehydrogenase family enzyme